ncbi:DUF3157 family protein [Wenyingzhuangia sp. IMCC45574]
MKKYIFLLFLLAFTVSFSQNNHIVKTDDGRRVLLKADYTWEYIDAVVPEKKEELKQDLGAAVAKGGCDLASDYKEPKLNNKIQTQLKRSKSSMKYIKKRVAKDFHCNVSDVILLEISELKERGVYYFCVNGKKVKYKRIGGAVLKAKKFF